MTRRAEKDCLAVLSGLNNSCAFAPLHLNHCCGLIHHFPLQYASLVDFCFSLNATDVPFPPRPDRPSTPPLMSLLGHVDLVLQPPLVAEGGESLQGLLQRDQLALLLGGGIVAVADVDGARVSFCGADD